MTVDTLLSLKLEVQLFHVDKRRMEEVADTTLALMLRFLAAHLRNGIKTFLVLCC
jgi:hypothetical protein